MVGRLRIWLAKNIQTRKQKYQNHKGVKLGDVKQKLPKSPFTCDKCKKQYIGQFRYLYETYEILPKYPKKEYIICEKCAIREYGTKNKKRFKDEFTI